MSTQQETLLLITRPEMLAAASFLSMGCFGQQDGDDVSLFVHPVQFAQRQEDVVFRLSTCIFSQQMHSICTPMLGTWMLRQHSSRMILRVQPFMAKRVSIRIF